MPRFKEAIVTTLIVVAIASVVGVVIGIVRSGCGSQEVRPPISRPEIPGDQLEILDQKILTNNVSRTAIFLVRNKQTKECFVATSEGGVAAAKCPQ